MKVNVNFIFKKIFFKFFLILKAFSTFNVDSQSELSTFKLKIDLSTSFLKNLLATPMHRDDKYKIIQIFEGFLSLSKVTNVFLVVFILFSKMLNLSFKIFKNFVA